MGRRVTVWVSEMSVASSITPEGDDAGIINSDIAGEHLAPMRGQSVCDGHPYAEQVASGNGLGFSCVVVFWFHKIYYFGLRLLSGRATSPPLGKGRTVRVSRSRESTDWQRLHTRMNPDQCRVSETRSSAGDTVH